MGSDGKLGWFAPAAAITGLVLLSAWLMVSVSGYTAPPPTRTFGYNWSLAMTIIASAWFTLTTILMMIRRVPSPIGHFITGARTHWRRIILVFIGFSLTGAIQLGFNWVKPQIAILFPFWADPTFAAMDHAIFGADPWLPLTRMLGDGGIAFLDTVYSLWYPVTLFALFGVLITDKGKAILSYFMLWGVFGTVTQALLSAAGPIFWGRIGLGERFDTMIAQLPPGTKGASEYLWMNHTAEINDLAVGISAMPSMHVAMACWIAIAYARTKLAPVGIAYWLLVFTGSVALGWHYFVDGVAGSLGALACWYLAGKIVELPAPWSRSNASPEPDWEGEPAPA
ncbi:MAG: phosphatase PAP2 family protein [Novosphingobium sp.]|nr:phosphatase PAP2 family protein [Novosphingobium sp.]